VDAKRDYTHQFKLTNLKPNARYQVRVEATAGGGTKGQLVNGRFKTAPRAYKPERVVFTVTTGQAYPDQDAPGGGYKIYPAMLKLDPSFFVHTGDIVYYDKLAKTLPLARWHWARMYSLPTNVDFHRQVPSYFIKDDHDTWMNDCWPSRKTKFMGDFTFEQGLEVFLEQVPMGEKTYRTFRWGRDLQIWLVEGRDFRSPNTMPDGPDKTIWGKEQKEWFKRTVQESDATFRILCSPTPLVGPDRTNKRDNHANSAFTHEGDELREFISKQKNMYVVCGDRHWQYVSVNAKTGVREYSCGPASDKHAGGWSDDMRYPEHQYLSVIGGFLGVIVDRSQGEPTVTFRHYSVDGDVLNEDRFTAQ
jgi:alkaline phosphatase D